MCVDHNTSEHASYTSWGSSVLYMAKYLQDVQAAAPLAISNYGPDLLPYLPGVDMLPAEPNQEQTLVYENDTRVQPRIWKAHNTEYAGPPQITPTVSEALQEADIVIVATLLPNYSPAYVQELLSYAKPTALRVLCPQGYFRHISPDGLVVPREFAEASEIVPLFNAIIYSEEDHPRAFEIARKWLQYTDDTQIIVTQGEKGASIVGSSATVAIPTTPLGAEEIVDSVGCGDVFAATFMYVYYQTKDPEEAVRAAHKAAAAKLLSTPLAKVEQ